MPVSKKRGLAFEKPEPAFGEPQGGVWTDRGMDRWINRQMDSQMYRFSLYSTGICPLRFPLEPLPKSGRLGQEDADFGPSKAVLGHSRSLKPLKG